MSEAVPSDPDHLGSRTARCQRSAAGPSTSRDRDTDGLEPEFRDASPIPPDNIQGVRGCVYAGSEDLCPRPISPTCQRSQAVIPRVNDQTSGEIRPANRPGRAEASGRRTAPARASGPGSLPTRRGDLEVPPSFRDCRNNTRGHCQPTSGATVLVFGTRPSRSDFARCPSPPRSPSTLDG